MTDEANIADWIDYLEDAELSFPDPETLRDVRAELIDKACRRGAISAEAATELMQHYGLA